VLCCCTSFRRRIRLNQTREPVSEVSELQIEQAWSWRVLSVHRTVQCSIYYKYTSIGIAHHAKRLWCAQTWITQFTCKLHHVCLYSPAAEHHRPLAGTHFTVPRRVEGWVDNNTIDTIYWISTDLHNEKKTKLCVFCIEKVSSFVQAVTRAPLRLYLWRAV